MLATDYDNQQQDSAVFPGRMSDAELRSIIPFVVWTSEFDMYRRDSVGFAMRGKACGKLLELGNMPGLNHGYQMTNFDSAETKEFYVQEALAFNAFVRCQ